MHLTVYLPAPARRLLEAEQLANENALVPSGIEAPSAWVSRLTITALLSRDTIARIVITILGEAKTPPTEAEIASAVFQRQGRRRLTAERTAVVVSNTLRALAARARTWDPIVEQVPGSTPATYRMVAIPD